MKRMLIAGWRGISHSFAMVNQHQILSLSRYRDIALNHVDMPSSMSHWNRKDHDAGFAAEDQAVIDSLQAADEASVDCVYRICAPMHAPGPGARRTLTFGVTELGYDKASLHDPDQDLAAITAGENLLITPSRWSRDRLGDFGFAESAIRVVPHGVDLNAFRPLSGDEIALNRQNLAISPETVVFLNVGVPTWNKGVDLLVRSFATLHRRNPNIRLILKDASSLYGYPVDKLLQNVSQEYPDLLTQGVLDAISVIPGNLTQAQLRQLYGFVDWYVSPYRAEGFNLPALEAQACGTPVITSSGGATDDFCNTDGVRKVATVFRRAPLGNFRECCWVEPDIAALEGVMQRAITEGPRKTFPSDPLRHAARSNAERYSWDSAVETLAALL